MSIKGFDDWLATSQGQYVLQWEQAKYDLLVADIFGFNAVQLGLPQQDFLRANRMPFRFRCDDQISSLAALRAKPHFLPFANASIDLVILPHVLGVRCGSAPDTTRSRTCADAGGSVGRHRLQSLQLVGARRKFSRSNSPPWRGQYLSVLRLKDWFALLGFETHAGNFGCYAPPVTREKWLQSWRFMELAGNRWWPYAGATYIIQAVKRVHGMRLITPLRKDRKVHAKSLATVTQHTQRREQQEP
jgi:hypothetical protein